MKFSLQNHLTKTTLKILKILKIVLFINNNNNTININNNILILLFIDSIVVFLCAHFTFHYKTFLQSFIKILLITY